MADFFFFTDVDLLSAQTNDGAFGPVVVSDPIYDSSKEKNRLTSMHKATTNPLAYAICKGQILVQEDSTNSALVNVILKPEVQPNIDLPFIKYYIYRGILKSSLTDGINIIDGGNTLTKFILNNNPTSSQKVLGIELTGTNYNNIDQIDNAFYLPKIGFELWTAFGGWSIGTFDKNNFGIEIIFERLGFNPDFNIGRSTTNIFEITKLIGTPSQEDSFIYKTKKEIITNYIDPCAFYGNFYSAKLNVRKSSDTIDVNNIPSFVKISGDDIYREVIEGGTLASPQNIFNNKNKIYLDIRNDLNYSYNYFENYDDNLRISFVDDNNEPSNLINYYSSGWPILQLSSLPIGNNSTSIRISLFINDNISPVVYAICGERKISLIERIKNGRSRFLNLDIDQSTSNFSLNSLFFITPNYNNNIAVSQYLKIKYLNRMEQSISLSTSPLNIMKRNDPWDVVFDVRGFITQTQNIQNNLNLFMFNEDVYVDAFTDLGLDFIGNVGYFQDLNDIFFFGYATSLKTRSQNKKSPRNFSLQNSNINSNIYNYIKSLKKNSILESIDLSLSTGPAQILRYGTIKNEQSNLRDVDLNKTFFIFSLSKTDWNNIYSLVSSTYAAFSPIVFIIKNRNDKDNVLTNDFDLNGIEYVTGEIHLRGLVVNSGTVSQADTYTNIKIYSFPNN